MKAFRYYAIPDAPLKLEEVPIRQLAEAEVLIKMKATGICGSDLNYVKGKAIRPPKLPVTLGHEMSGVIEKLGKNVTGLSEGDRVVVDYVKSCGNCYYCNQGREDLCANVQYISHNVDGGDAEYVIAPARNAFELPDTVPFEQGAIIGCAIATSLHAIGASGMRPGETVTIFGLGGVGMHAVKWAKIFGAGKIIGVDVDPRKLEMAKDFGADITLDARYVDVVSEIVELTSGQGTDVAIECAGLKETLEKALASLAKGGRMALVGIYYETLTISPLDILGKEKRVVGSVDHTRNDLRRAINLIAAGRMDLSRSVTHRVKFENLNDGIELLRLKSESPLRVVAVQ